MSVLTDSSQDLGFGRVVSERRNLRLLNRDGTFNVSRSRVPWLRALTSYYGLLTMSWPRFFALLTIGYFALNFLFAAAYLACGNGALQGDPGTSPFARAFFFSVHTSATIGYGNVHPVGLPANLLVTAEAFSGLMGFALGTSLLFARFSRPTAEIAFSRNAVIAPYRGITALEFRIMNRRRSELIDVRARVVLSRFEEKQGRRARVYYPLSLEREAVAFFPANWTVVHPIDETSPLFNWTAERVAESQAELLVLLTAVDETFSETVHSRTSYAAGEIVWNAVFVPMFIEDARGLRVDPGRLHMVQRAG